MLDLLMIEVASRLPELGFDGEEVVLIDESRVAYLTLFRNNSTE
jgi:hypothetical protein